MSIYTEFASVYDRMQYDVDYDFWIDGIVNIVKEHNRNAKSMLELACGTGTLSIGISKKGFLMEGIDISEDMLTIAQAKAYESGAKVRYYHQDMITFNTRKKYDAIFCMCDGMNYVTCDDDMRKVFANISSHLNPEGILIFDLSSKYKLSEVIGNHTFAETFEDEAYIWENEFDDAHHLLRFTFTLFKNDGEGYVRHEENHVQRAYEIEEIKELAKEHFELQSILDGDTFGTLEFDANRICFVMTPRK